VSVLRIDVVFSRWVYVNMCNSGVVCKMCSLFRVRLLTEQVLVLCDAIIIIIIMETFVMRLLQFKTNRSATYAKVIIDKKQL